MIADSSFLVSLFYNGDPLNKKADAIFNSLGDEKIILPISVIEETFTVLSYRAGTELALGFLQSTQENKDFLAYYLTPEEWQEIPKLACALKKKLSFADYFVIYLCKKTGEKPLCFDRQLLSILKKP